LTGRNERVCICLLLFVNPKQVGLEPRAPLERFAGSESVDGLSEVSTGPIIDELEWPRLWRILRGTNDHDRPIRVRFIAMPYLRLLVKFRFQQVIRV
jgi:hypothetical protein